MTQNQTTNIKRVASGIPINNLPASFQYLIAGEQAECAVNDKRFNQAFDEIFKVNSGIISKGEVQ